MGQLMAPMLVSGLRTSKQVKANGLDRMEIPTKGNGTRMRGMDVEFGMDLMARNIMVNGRRVNGTVKAHKCFQLANRMTDSGKKNLAMVLVSGEVLKGRHT